MFDSLIAQGHIILENEDLNLTVSGAAFAEGFGIDLGVLQKARTPLCRECLDWSERRSHLAGSLGMALLTRFEQLTWASRDQKTRVISFSQTGATAFHKMFPKDLA